MLLLDGEAQAQAAFVYVPSNHEVPDSQPAVNFELTVNDSTIVTRADVVYAIQKNVSSGRSCYHIAAKFMFESYVGVCSFNLTARVGLGGHSYTGHYVVAGVVFVAPPTRGQVYGAPRVVSGTDRRGLVVGSAPLDAASSTSTDGIRCDVVSLVYQPPVPNPRGLGLLEIVSGMRVAVHSKVGAGASGSLTSTGVGKSGGAGGAGGLLQFDNVACSPLHGATPTAGGWSFGSDACDIAVNAPTSPAGNQASIVIRVPSNRLGSSIAAITIPDLVVDGEPFETTLKITSNGTTPILVLNSTASGSKFSFIELDHFGTEIVNLTMLNTKIPRQQENCTEYYLSLPGGRYASYEGNVNTLGVTEQNVTFTTASPSEGSKDLNQAIFDYAYVDGSALADPAIVNAAAAPPSAATGAAASGSAFAIDPRMPSPGPVTASWPGSAAAPATVNVDNPPTKTKAPAAHAVDVAASSSPPAAASPTAASVLVRAEAFVNGSESYAFVRVGNATNLTRAMNSPPGCVLVTSFASPVLAKVDANASRAKTSRVLQVPLVISGYTTRNFSEFKSAGVKQALRASLRYVSGTPVQFYLANLTASKAGIACEYEAYLPRNPVGKAAETSILDAVKKSIGEGTLSRDVRLRHNQLALSSRGLTLENRAGLNSLSGVGRALGVGGIIAIVVLSTIPLVALCVGMAMAGHERSDERSVSDDGASRRPPIDGSSLFIAPDGHGRGARGINAPLPASLPAAGPPRAAVSDGDYTSTASATSP